VSEAVDPARCPLCGDANACAMLRGEDACWCAGAAISTDALARIPQPARGVACLCAACASGAPPKAAPARR
jgi:hypothetical protein